MYLCLEMVAVFVASDLFIIVLYEYNLMRNCVKINC